MKLVIDRDTWLRGKGGAVLLDSDGCMCCLGFLAMALGASEEHILDLAGPSDTPDIKWPPALVPLRVPSNPDDYFRVRYRDSDFACELMNLNDSEETSEAKREADVAAMLLQAGIEVEFIGGAS